MNIVITVVVLLVIGGVVWNHMRKWPGTWPIGGGSGKKKAAPKKKAVPAAPKKNAPKKKAAPKKRTVKKKTKI